MLQNIIAANYNIIHICQAENLVFSIVGFACVSLASYRYYTSITVSACKIILLYLI